MGPRAALILAAASALLGLGCADESSSFESDFGVSTDMGVSRDLNACFTPISISSNPAPEPGGFVYFPAELTAVAQSSGRLGTPEWTVTVAGVGSFVPTIVDMQSRLIVRFTADRPGSYTFRVSFTGSGNPCPGMQSIEVRPRTARGEAYRLRVSPPEGAGVPQQDQVLTVYGSTPLSAHAINLQKGTPLSGMLNGPAGGVPGEVRLLAESGPDAVARTAASGSFALALSADSQYTPLLIPDGASLAPRLMAKATGTQLLTTNFTVGAGQVVSGSVRDPANVEIAGARLLLRAGRLPSSVGLTVANGTYALRAEAATYRLLVGADGWPELNLDGVVVGTAPLAVDVTYRVARATISATVVDTDGTSAISGARVTVRSSSLLSAANINIDGVVRAAAGRVAQVEASASDGALPALKLPDGEYDILIEPPAGSKGGVTALQRTVAGDGSWTLTLQPRVTLAGTLRNEAGGAVAGARVTAIHTAGLGTAPAVVSDSAGRYSVVVERGSPVTLLIEPPGESRLLSVRKHLSAGATMADVTLPPGLLVSGIVYSPTGTPMGSVVIEALCSACGSSLPVASTVSDPTGNYQLYLPDPGFMLFDGGVTD